MRNKMENQKITTNGNGFTVLEARDGYRQDNSLWFGECSVCGEHLSNSRSGRVWKHTVYTEKGFYSKEIFEQKRFYNQASSYQVDYCPKLENKVVETVVWYLVDGEKVFA
jgi:hypothetical protein